MKKLQLLFIIIICFSCEGKINSVKKTKEQLICEIETEEAEKALIENRLSYILINNHPRYYQELTDVLKANGIELELIPSLHGEGYCKKEIMDNVLLKEYGGVLFRIDR